MSYEKNGLEIAIVGMSGRFPGSKSIDDFWENLKAGVNLTSTFPNPRPSKLADGTTKVGSILDNIELFDASFFGFNPREAETMDPQHKMFLECAWEALENAGYDSEIEQRPIGVYAGTGISTYLLYNLHPNRELMDSMSFLQTLVGVDKDYVPTRVSYKLNLKGPSVSVGTACSSSLVAVHLACQSLLSGECDMALAAGVAVKVPQNELTLSPEGIISPDGKCRAFDAKANGTIGGNGIGVVVLKRLDDAIAERDCIYAVIKGSAINNDGGLKVGYTAPSEEGQSKVIRSAQIMAEVEPETISYIEAHGTGTPLGDPIEIAALTQAFRANSDQKGYCAIGSVKTNVGHLDAAAGIVGLIKTILALHHKLLPPSINFETPNPQIDFENSPFYVNSKLSEWKASGNPRRAGVSSFGIGGTNAHLILEEAPTPEASSPSRAQQLLILSAKTNSGLETATANLVNYLEKDSDVNLADVAYTLQVGRRAFNYRRTIVAENVEDAVKTLTSNNPQRVFTNFIESSDRAVVFMFTGQGSQYVNMARELYQSELIFREECDRCFQLLQPHLGLDLGMLIYPSKEETEKATQQLQQTAITQPALFVIEYALAKLLISWGIQPQSIIGHSIGEYVAACIGGVFSLEDALSLVATRGKMMQQLPYGTMISVSLSAEKVQLFLNENLFLAASNSPSLSVVSGTIEAVENLERQLAEKGIEYRQLHTSHAFHSAMMDSIIEPFVLALKKVKFTPPQIPFISNLTGTWITAAEAIDPNYWARHLRETVRFSEGIAELIKDSQLIFLEVGPGRTLTTLAKQQASGRIVLSSLPHPKDQESDSGFLLNTLGKLWLAGVRVDWSGFYASEKRDRIPLPTYPFERQRYWIDPPAESGTNPQVKLDRKPDIADWFYIPSWKRSLLSTHKSNTVQVQSCYLVFIDECGLGVELLKRLERQNQEVITVKIGSEFAKFGEDVYTINPQQPNDYKALVKALFGRENIPKTIAHLWTITGETQKSGWEWIDRAQETGFYSLLFLAQALGDENLTNELPIVVFSNNLQEVTGDELLCPEKATLLGTVKAIAQEYPNINCRSIDVVLPSSGSWQEKLLDQLLTEIVADNPKSNDAIVAYRGNNRWLQTFEPVQLNEALEETPVLREGGVYLITGGLGGIGLVLAENLAKTVRAKLVLVGRSAFPDRNERSQWLATHDDQDTISRKIRKLLEFEESGAEVLVATADVTNLEQMQVAIEIAQKQFGHIDGVIHAAGVPGGGIIQRKTREEAERILAPKVKGTLVLDLLLKDVELDFFVLFSSLASVIGGVGQVDYAGANAFLDAFSHYKISTNGTFTTCINWDAWQEVGMAAEEVKQFERNQVFPISEIVGAFEYMTAAKDISKIAIPWHDKREAEEVKYNVLASPNPQFPAKGLPTKFIEDGLLPSEGINVFRRILESKLPQILVSTRDLMTLIERHNSHSILSFSETGETTNLSQATHPRPELSNAYIAPLNELEETIANIWQKFLGVKQVGIHDNFFELGGHSLLATQVIAQMRLAIKMDLPLSILFDAPTVADISQYIEKIRLTTEKFQAPINTELDDRMEIEL
ncbi:type I polyketide synthase [Microcoleus asticus]|uniref:Phthiocerol synthesis polyketide synthase type I PpsE n=1 Tax=Microcoleus asticus IPMA8 TaxID=2563858 RepID=A0ABX2CZT0_9CYAN|nr:type I polyketide synthase [Microcoleus asticus]NQE34940.1 Phthiocerol synthesis polyketide synthase type I PpsE [Microcoleus asticus IPMA8]